MSNSYVLIDYENVQPKNLSPLKHPDFHVHVFIGATQKSLSTDIVTALQPFGANGKWVQITGNGKNALDFHIAYYVGLLTAKENDATCYIVSKDKGFDPLVKHLKASGAKAIRVADINKIPVLKTYSEKTPDAKVDKIVANRRQSKKQGKKHPKNREDLTQHNKFVVWISLKAGRNDEHNRAHEKQRYSEN